MAETSPQQPAKPGTACLGCRRRKLKCSREQEGCTNCTKAELPCVYPALETGVKRKRGPYKKDKAPRERHLEDLVKYLEPKAGQNGASDRVGLGEAVYAREDERSPSTASGGGHEGQRGTNKTGNSEDLVKDALIALTKSSVEHNESSAENGFITSQPADSSATGSGTFGMHPPIRQIFEYWHLFVRRVDPLLKIIHCLTFEETLLKALEDLQSIGPVMESLLFAIYYAAVGSCTNRECRTRFGESREVLLQRYGRVVEAALADNYNMPVLESLQALVIYIICIRRDDSVSNIRALFSLAVRMAQLIGLHEDPVDAFSPFEAELRRRLWWHICGLESRGAEEGGARQTSIMEERDIHLPLNLNDCDIRPDMRDPPMPRNGITDLTFVLARWESVRVVHSLFSAKKKYKSIGQRLDSPDLQKEQRLLLAEHKARCEAHYLQYLDQSRPMDWMVMQWIRLMGIKSRLIIDYPFGQVPTKEMTPQARHDLLRASVEVISISHGIGSDKGIDDWLWYFRGWVQWHSIAIVIAELGGNKNQPFVNTAWTVLDPILADWDKVYRAKKDEPAWVHVNALIEKARQIRRQIPQVEEHQIMSNQLGTDNIQTRASPYYSQISRTNRTPGSGVIGLVPNGAWSSAWDSSNGFNMASETMMSQYQPPEESTPIQQQYQAVSAPMMSDIDIPFQIGCAPAMPGFDYTDFGYIEGLDGIDYAAFDYVFKDMAWDFSSPSTDAYVENLGASIMPG